MGKFPGKPSKIVNRKRIKVLKCSTTKEDDSVKAAETIYYGLTVFNETFGNEEQNASDFQGFTRKEIQLSVNRAKLHLRDIEAECKFNGYNISLHDKFNAEISEIKHQHTPSRRSSTKNKKQCFDGGGKCIRAKDKKDEQSSLQKPVSKSRKKQCFDGGGVVVDDQVEVENEKYDECLHLEKKSPVGYHAGNSNFKNSAAKKLLQKAMKSCHVPLTGSDSILQDKGLNGALRKFVLPSRSAHSSRVIKPNKRFIEVDENTEDVNVNQSPSVVQLKRPKLILSPVKSSEESESNQKTCSFSESLSVKDGQNSRLGCLDFDSVVGNLRGNSEDNSSSPPHDGALIVEGKRRWKPSYKVQLKLRELNVFGAGTSRFPFRRNLGSSTDASESVNSGSDRETISQSTSGHATDRSESDILATSTLSDNKVNSNKVIVHGTKLNTSSKVILKEARLKLNTQTSSLCDGPFSNSMHLGSSLPETVECGVCGAVRFYRFVKQARKFGIFSCESCRKFISKMIKRLECSTSSNLSPLECHKGEGMCSVPPIVRSQQWKAGRGTLVRCSYKARCPACWLKMCLRSFKMPDNTRTGLISMLPFEMQNGLSKTQTTAVHQGHSAVSNEDLSSSILNRSFRLGFADLPVADSNRLPKEWPTPVPVLFQRDPFGHQKNCNQRAKQKNSNSQKQHNKQKKNEKDQSSNHNSKSNSQIQSAKLLKKASKSLSINKELNSSKKKKRSGGMKVSRKEGSSSGGVSGSVWSSHRQRIDLKGPRVKHVCRSASIVLGQVPATFPSDLPPSEQRTKQKSEMAKTKTKPSCCLECKDTENVVSKPPTVDKLTSGRSNSGEVTKISAGSVSNDGKVDTKRTSVADEIIAAVQEESNVLSISSQSYKKVGLKHQPVTRCLPIPGKRHNPEALNQVSIDFWESYDPEEVCNTGFGLIGSEPFHVRAICFLCGSGGLEQLIHCASCCEPYHRFCLEDGLRDTGEGWRYNWICQRCTVCHTCGRGQGQQLSCQRCHKTYHTECLGSSRLHSPDRPWVCPSCLRCKSCGAADVTVFVGNLPLCKACFKLRQKGNYCPLCQRCYEDHDYDTKMMECAKCSCWVHAKCEGLSDEKYQVLSYLPESVEFVCRMCCTMPPASWWIAVEEELRAGYLSVLKSLSKNRKACAMLKSSPKKQCSCRIASVGKQLSFHDHAEIKEPSESRVKEECLENCVDSDTTTTLNITTTCEISSSNGEETIVPAQTATICPDVARDNYVSFSTSRTNPIISSPVRTEMVEVGNKDALSSSGELLITKCNSVSSLSIKSESSVIHQETSPIEISLSAPVLQFSDSDPQEPSSKTSVVIDPALKLYWEKYNIRECSVRVEDILPRPTSKTLLPVKVEVPCNDLLQDGAFCENGKSPLKVLPASLSTPCSDSGISSTDEELKPCVVIENNKELVVSEPTLPDMSNVNTEIGEAGYSSSNGDENPVSESEGGISETSNDVSLEKMCHCLEVTQSKPSLTLLSVKKKVNASEYSSLLQFHQEMESLISRSQAGELLETYHHTLQEVFPWFDPKYARVSSRPMHEDHFYCQSPSKLLSIETGDNSFNDESKMFSESGKENLEDKISKTFVDKDQNYYYSSACIPDVRVCVLCKGTGDGPSTEEGRLLYSGQNEWAHTNCALWSAEVFEEIDGSLQNVHSAVSRGRMIRCPWCEKRGASVGCCARNCNETYHFPCARKAKCTFMDDKNVYCPTHAREATGKILILDSEFDVRRPIYVELDRKKKKFSDVAKVKFMIGSLLVENLGEFVPGASDNADIIIPNGFRCTRYFWSSVEPWRVVQYQVKTIFNQQLPEKTEDLGWNITIDHSEDQEVVEQKQNEIVQWHRELTRGRKPCFTSKFMSFSESGDQKSKEKVIVSKNVTLKTEEDQVAHQVVSYLLDTICSKDVDDSCLTDPQSTADILPPELKDAIFEELPHDLLDGISMQDIFPKLMSYEDGVGIDFKSDGSCGSDGLKDGKDDLSEEIILATDVDTAAMLTHGKKNDTSVIEQGSQAESWFPCVEPKEQVQHLVEDLLPPLYAKNSAQKLSGRELKRSKSDGISQSSSRKSSSSSRSQQRSCSLAWSCKLDGSAASHSKRRKATRAASRSQNTEASNNTTTDSICSERASMLQELRLPESGLGSLPRTSTASASSSTVESVRELKMRLEDEGSTTQADRRKASHPKEEGKENKWLLWHSHSQTRILQLDGTVDTSSSGSEGGKSPRRIDDDEDDDDDEEEEDCSNRVQIYLPAVSRRSLPANILKKDGEDEPVRCSRCHRTYRTKTSFERHLPTCSSDFILSTSESDSENTRSSEEESPKQFKQDICSKAEDVHCEPNIKNDNDAHLSLMPALNVSVASQGSSQTSPVDSSCQTNSNSPEPSTPPGINRTSETNLLTSLQSTSLPPVSNPLSSVSSVVQSTILSSNSSTRTQTEKSFVTCGVSQSSPSNSIKPIIQLSLPSHSSQTNSSSPARARSTSGRSRARASSRSASQRQNSRNISCQPAVSTTATSTTTHNPQYQMHMVHTPCAQASSQPTVFVQQVPSPNVVPAFVEAFQQHTGQSLQYIATIDAHAKHPLFTSSPGSIVPGTFQLQASPESFTGIQNSSIPVMPSVQISPPQPTVLGTIIPQAQPAAIQCGMVATEQMMLGSSPSMEVYTDQNGGMFVASQPMFIGLETIVSNTVMQSQQIVSSALPGVMAASSSFSATTTQVFQASKLEPIVDVPSGFVIVNPQATLSDARMRNPEVVTCAPTHVTMSLPSQMASQTSPVVAHPLAPPAPVPPPPPPAHPPPTSNPVSAPNPTSIPAPICTPASAPVPAFPPQLIRTVPPLSPPPLCPISNHVPASVAQTSLESNQQNMHWRYTRDFLNESSNCISVSRNCDPYVAQVPQNITNHFCSSNNNSLLPVSKNVVTVSSAPPPVTISSHQPISPVKLVKTISTVCSTESNHQIFSHCDATKTIQTPHKPVPKVEMAPQQTIAIQKVPVEIDNKSSVVPVVNTKCVPQNSKTNTLKLVLQKQTQDGLYKVTPNQGVRVLSAAKQVTAMPVNKCVKSKPRPMPVEKLKDQENHFIPTVLQPSQNNNNMPNGNVNGSKYIPNGKFSFLKDGSPTKDVSSPITFELHSQDGFCCTSSDITEVWQKVFEAVQQARIAHKMPPLPQNPFMAAQDGLQMLGLKNNGLRYLVEQLPGAGRCVKYKPRYHKQHPPSPEEDIDALPPVNKTGSARSQPFLKRSPYDMFSWLASRHRQPPKFIGNADGESISNRRATSSNLPMAMRFRHLKETSKEAVGVYRSHIHGRGLFCLRDIDAGEMVIEYAGEVIRSTLTDKREKLYESKGIGCYMFRIDDQLVVDATMRGNAARFINHSCEPNCYSRVVDILGKKHILIFALRRIPQGEELTYDYKFPFEDVKIPCTCGSRRCRKYLN